MGLRGSILSQAKAGLASKNLSLEGLVFCSQLPSGKMGNDAIDSILSGVTGKEQARPLSIMLNPIWSSRRHSLRGQHVPGLGLRGHEPAVLPILRISTS